VRYRVPVPQLERRFQAVAFFRLAARCATVHRWPCMTAPLEFILERIQVARFLHELLLTGPTSLGEPAPATAQQAPGPSPRGAGAPAPQRRPGRLTWCSDAMTSALPHDSPLVGHLPTEAATCCRAAPSAARPTPGAGAWRGPAGAAAGGAAAKWAARPAVAVQRATSATASTPQTSAPTSTRSGSGTRTPG